MVRSLLIRGMLVGVVAGLLTFGFSKVFGEPQVDRAIAFETQLDEARAAQDAAKGMHHEDEPELVSRSVQAGLGLFTGVVVYCTAFGGLFALVFAAANGRVGKCSPRTTAALLAGAGFVAIYLVPALKYPANPPSVGQPDTIDQRTALYVAMMLVSIAAMVGAVMLRNLLARRRDAWFAALIAGAGYLVIVFAAQLLLPSINEVPEQFPAVLLWNFRIASLGTQAVMWTTLGLLFGWLTERAVARQRGSARNMRFAATQS